MTFEQRVFVNHDGRDLEDVKGEVVTCDGEKILDYMERAVLNEGDMDRLRVSCQHLHTSQAFFRGRDVYVT